MPRQTERASKHFAHSLPAPAPEADWQPLDEHLKAVGELAKRFAKPFGAESMAQCAGLLHDLGKYTEAFQRRIRGAPERVDHATWGARVALERFGPLGYFIAYAVAGHHAGLPNGEGDAATGRSSLQARLRETLSPLLDVWQDEVLITDRLLPPGSMSPRHRDQQQFMAAFLVRMLFSCLVDADFLDTEAFYAQAEGRDVQRGGGVGIDQMQAAVQTHLEAMSRHSRPTAVNEARRSILDHVRRQAQRPPGLYSLTVPTGGGKTLTSLAFGLDHAKAHGLRRLIYVIPFTSIVEQNAQVFRDALGECGEDAVLEHHSAFIDDPSQAKEAKEKTRLAMENWDRPLVVTTAVQFFESLFADRPSQCRKLHRIAGSVIVLDEAQTLPLGLLRPTLLALDELSRNYGCTIVFCTATQPALADSRFRDVIGALHELAPEPTKLFETFRRVHVQHAGPLDDAAVIERMAARPQALCIVNNRLQARALFKGLAHLPGSRHLSTLMCAKHRSQVLAQVREDLAAGLPCRVISTSLIEAGVDISFPFVMRAEAGLDSIAQAAGRCNREGRWPVETSEVQVFTADASQWRPPAVVKQLAAVASQVLQKYAADPIGPAAIQHYFEELYWARGTAALDEHDLIGRLKESRLQSLPFEDIARLYRLIDATQMTLIVPFDDEAVRVIRLLEFADGVNALARRLQTYSVQVPRQAFDALRKAGAIQPVAQARWGEQFMVLVNKNLYDQRFGLFWEDPSFLKSTQLVI